jgi:hypothetical protein
MLLRYERVGTREVNNYRWVDFWEVVGPSGLEVVGYRYGPWKWYRGEDREYIWTGGEWERIGEVRKRMDVPLQLCLIQYTLLLFIFTATRNSIPRPRPRLFPSVHNYSHLSDCYLNTRQVVFSTLLWSLRKSPGSCVATLGHLPINHLSFELFTQCLHQPLYLSRD